MKPNIFYFIFVTIILNLLGARNQKSYGQALPYVVEHYTSENGLPQNSIKFLLFDKNGYLWMGSESGLIRFDNKELKVYGNNNIPGMLDERIQDMKLDSQGNVYAKNTHYQPIITTPKDSISSPLPRIFKGVNDFYFPTWGYISHNPLIGSLWDSLRLSADLPGTRVQASLANGDIYLFLFEDVYYINKGYKLVKRWPVRPLANLPLGANEMIQFWKKGEIAVWQGGQLMAHTNLKGDVLNNDYFLQGNFKVFWCPAGSYIYADNSLYKIFLDQGVITTKRVLKNLSIASPDCLNYNPSSNTYYFGSKTAGLYIVKVPDFNIFQIPKQTGADYFYSVAKLPGDTLVVRNTIIPPKGAAYYKNLDGSFFTSYVDSSGRLYYENEFSLNSYNAQLDVIRKLLPLDEHLVSILPYLNNRLLLCTHASCWITTKKGKVIAQKSGP